MMPRLSIKCLAAGFGDTSVLEDLSLDVAPGETVAIMGKSGSGKSTLLYCCAGLKRPHQGTIALDGVELIQDGSPLPASAGMQPEITMVFQDYGLFPNLTVLRNVSLALERVKKTTAADARDSARAILAGLEVGQLETRYPHQLSGGQSQRVALARALVLQPKVLLLDEITSALDPETIQSVIAALDRVRQLGDADMSIVLVTHLLRFAQSFSHRIAFVHRGRIWECQTASDFVSKPQTEEAASFIAAVRLGM